jgi:hypothetical protein
VVDDGDLKDPRITSRADQTVPNAQRPVAGGRVVSGKDRGGKKNTHIHTHHERLWGYSPNFFRETGRVIEGIKRLTSPRSGTDK